MMSAGGGQAPGRHQVAITGGGSGGGSGSGGELWGCWEFAGAILIGDERNLASAVLGFFSPMAHPVRNGLYLNGQKLNLSEGLMFTLGGGTWLSGCVQCCVRLKNEIRADFYSRGRTSVVLICEFSSKKNFSLQTLQRACGASCEPGTSPSADFPI